LLSRPRVDTLLLPGGFGSLYGVSYWIPDARAIRAMVSETMSDSAAPAARNVRELRVAIVSSDVALAKAARAKLRGKGYTNTFISDARPGNPLVTTILSPSSIGEARAVGLELGFGTAFVSGEGVLGADISVRVGRDFQP
jgi:polyisoprenyl-teichoic acid--peptidoglycan teichoic acid transferase